MGSGEVAGGEGGGEGRPRKIQGEVVAELGGGEVGIIPVEGVRGGGKLNGMLMDPT